MCLQNQNEDGHRTGRSTSMTWFSSLTRKSGSAVSFQEKASSIFVLMISLQVKITSPKKRTFSNTLSPSRRTPESEKLNR